MYRSSISIDLLAQRNAYIYSAKIRGELTRELKQRGMPDSLEPEKFGGIGHLYPSKMHTMRTNTAWMLGLAHRAVPVVMATPLQETTLVRNAAPPGERTVEKHASAFIREIVAMLRGGFFTVSEDERGKKIFHPTGKARTATLDQMLTPPQMNREELDALLASYGLQVEPDQAIAREPRVGFNPVEWVGNLLQQDLEDPVQGFPRLDTCIRAGVAIPAELFQGIQEKLAAATPEKKGPLTAMLGKMLEGVGDDDDAMRALLHAASALSEADTVAGRQELTGLIHGKAISLQSDEQRNRVWARLSADVVAAEMQVSGDAGFPLVRHLCTLHESQAQHADARGSGPALPIERETFAPVVQARNLAPEAAERAIELLRFLLQTGEGDEPDVDALVNLARELPYFQSEELQAAAVQLANEAMERVSDPDARNEAHFYICRAMVSIEAGRPNPNSRLLSEIPMEAEFVAAAALQILYSPEEGTEKLSFLKGLIDALPGAREQEKALMLVAEMLPGARSGERLDQCLALIEERMRLGVSSESLHRAICKNLLRRPEEDHERTLDRLAAFGIVPDRELLVDVLRTIDDPYCEHGGQLCRLAREISNKLPADQKTEAMGDLLYCLQFGRPVPERLGLLETVLENAGSSGTGHDEPIALQIANTLAVVQDDLMKLPNVREVLRSVRQAIPEVFESDPDLAFAQLELAETDTQRKQILDRVLNDLPDCTRRSRERFEKMADLAASACDRFENPNLRSEALAGLATILERDEIFSQPWATDMMIWAMGSRVGKADALPLRALKAVIASIERLDEEGNQMHWHVMQDIGSQLGLPPRDRGVMDLVRDAREEIARREGAE